MWVCPQCRLELPEGRFCPADGSPLFSRTGDVPGLELDREVGRGLTGTVWRAHDEAGRLVAVKVLHREWAEHGEMRERFEREARAASVVNHPSVVAPLAVGELADGRPYIVMELVDGPSLEEVLALGPLPEPRAAELAGQLADALAACHRAGVIHRDVKPGNIRIGRDGRARLLDFGVARQIDVDEPRLTQGGLAVGTPHYMSPEQCTGELVTGRADVYALGCVLYRMLSGTVPFEGAAVAVMLAHAVREATPLAERASVSPAIADLVMRCLAKRAGDRPAASELADALRGGQAPVTRLRFERAQTVPSDPLLDAESESESVPLPLPLPLPDLDDITSELPAVRRPFHWGRWLAAAVAFAIAILAFDIPARVERMLSQRPAGAAAEQPMPVEDLPAPPAGWHRYLVASDDGIMLRVGTPARIRRGADAVLTVEAWDPEGEAFDTTDLVVTFAGPDGAVLGFAAEPDAEPGLYRVRTRFDVAGGWVLRVFPPHGDAMVTFHLDVE